MNKNEGLENLINRYYSKLAQVLPVVTSSDEFYFLPSSDESTKHLDKLETLSIDEVSKVINTTKEYLSKTRGVQTTAKDQEIDRKVFTNMLNAVLREIEDYKVYQTDATLYLKICNLGLDRAMSLSKIMGMDPNVTINNRLDKISELFKNGIQNINKMTTPNKEIALEMLLDTQYFLSNDVKHFIETKIKNSQESEGKLSKVMENLSLYEQHLKGIEPVLNYAAGEEYLERVFKESYGYNKSIEQSYETGKVLYQETLDSLSKLAKEINPNKGWKELLDEYVLNWDNEIDLTNLYNKEILNLKEFLHKKDLFDFTNNIEVIVKDTPRYMRSIRAYAAYNAPVDINKGTPGIFFVTPPNGGLSLEDHKKLLNNIHRDYWLVSAHETYPGHHLLDVARKRHENPLRRQVENVLYYEGWAFYSEELIVEQGYITEPIKKLVQLKYQLWRALRVLLDIELHTGKETIETSAQKLIDLGHIKTKAYNEARKYTQTPGYQLTYTLGKYEIKKLRAKYEKDLGLKKFHNIMLDNGQIPFDYIDELMRGAVSGNKDLT